MDDTIKAKLENFVDADGKIMVSDDMPDDLKYAINYLNSNNINILDSSDIDNHADEEPEDFSTSVEMLDSEESTPESVNIEHISDEISDENINDLNDIF